MRNAQVMNFNIDRYLTIDGDNVIDDITQVKITASPIDVIVSFYDCTDGSVVYVGLISHLQMTYHSEVDAWSLDTQDFSDDGSIADKLIDRHKYIGYIEDTDAVMRSIKISEFVVDKDGFEDTMMRLPYQIECGAESKIVWYDAVANFGDHDHALYYAEAYEGGEGTTFATTPTRVTHRGPILASGV